MTNETQMTKDNESGIKALLKGFAYTMKQVSKNAPYDKTYVGLITAVNTETNTYSVKINGHTYTDIMSMIRSYVGHTVVIMCPQNQLSQMFIYGEIDTTDYS